MNQTEPKQSKFAINKTKTLGLIMLPFAILAGGLAVVLVYPMFLLYCVVRPKYRPPDDKAWIDVLPVTGHLMRFAYFTMRMVGW